MAIRNYEILKARSISCFGDLRSQASSLNYEEAIAILQTIGVDMVSGCIGMI